MLFLLFCFENILIVNYKSYNTYHHTRICVFIHIIVCVYEYTCTYVFVCVSNGMYMTYIGVSSVRYVYHTYVAGGLGIPLKYSKTALTTSKTPTRTTKARRHNREQKNI